MQRCTAAAATLVDVSSVLQEQSADVRMACGRGDVERCVSAIMASVDVAASVKVLFAQRHVSVVQIQVRRYTFQGDFATSPSYTASNMPSSNPPSLTSRPAARSTQRRQSNHTTAHHNLDRGPLLQPTAASTTTMVQRGHSRSFQPYSPMGWRVALRSGRVHKLCQRLRSSGSRYARHRSHVRQLRRARTIRHGPGRASGRANWCGDGPGRPRPTRGRHTSALAATSCARVSITHPPVSGLETCVAVGRDTL